MEEQTGQPIIEGEVTNQPEWKKQEGELLAKPTAEMKRKEEIKQKRVNAMANARAAKKKAAIPQHNTPIPPPAIKVEKGSEEPIVFFTEADIDPVTKKIKNTYPTYFNRKQREDLEEEVRKIEKSLSPENIKYLPSGDVPFLRERLNKTRAALDKIHESAPIFEKNKDRIHGMNKELGEKIRDAQFSRSDMMKGIADAHEEARRMSEPTIELPPHIAGIALANGIRVHGGRKVTRDDAVRLWQFGQKALGENTDAESLRRD